MKQYKARSVNFGRSRPYYLGYPQWISQGVAMCQLVNITCLILLISILICIIYISIVQGDILWALASSTFWPEAEEMVREHKDRQDTPGISFS